MQTLKDILRIMLWLATIVAFVVMVFKYFVKPSVVGIAAMWAFAVLFTISFIVEIPSYQKGRSLRDEADDDNINRLSH